MNKNALNKKKNTDVTNGINEAMLELIDSSGIGNVETKRFSKAVANPTQVFIFSLAQIGGYSEL
jgi:hypothetical protein